MILPRKAGNQNSTSELQLEKILLAGVEAANSVSEIGQDMVEGWVRDLLFIS